MSWEKLDQVSGQSPYVDDLVQTVESFCETLKPLIEQKKYLRNFFDKACRLVLPFRVWKCAQQCTNFSLVLTKFTNAAVKSRPLKEIGGEQVCWKLLHSPSI
jgi:hypothetical protein